MPKHVIIASKNPVKITAVENGFRQLFKTEEFAFDGVSTKSDVSDQPFSNNETLQGAINRANNAKRNFPQADFWVGIEGGLESDSQEMAAFAWVVILSNSQMGKAKTSSFFLPKAVINLINQGKELGEADDLVFGTSNSKQKNGAVGLLTNNIIDRARYYTEAVILALIPFKNPHLY